MKNYDDLIRRSIRKDFAKANYKRQRREPKTPHSSNTRRVVELNDNSNYRQFRRYIVGRLVRIIESGYNGGYWVEFVRDADRNALNAAAGWSSGKTRYLLDGVKFDD
jgi:hypothetical protein